MNVVIFELKIAPDHHKIVRYNTEQLCWNSTIAVVGNIQLKDFGIHKEKS